MCQHCLPFMHCPLGANRKTLWSITIYFTHCYFTITNTFQNVQICKRIFLTRKNSIYLDVLGQVITSICFFYTKQLMVGVPPQLSGFVCAFHHAAPGSTPKHSIYAFIIYSENLYYICPCVVKKDENKPKRGRVWPIFF